MSISKSITQHNPINILIEKIIRSHPLIYLFSKKILSYTSIFEDDMKGVKYLKFKNTKINYIDVGASDGVSVRFFNKILNFNKILCYEPNPIFKKRLSSIRSQKIKVFFYGISNKSGSINLYVPVYYLFNIKLYLHTYIFYQKKALIKQLNLDFIFKKNIKIEKISFNLKKPQIKNFKADLIKIDVNGHEYEVVKSLKHIIFRNNPALIIERGSHIKKISKFLAKKKYSKYTYDIVKKKFVRGSREIPLSYYYLTENYL